MATQLQQPDSTGAPLRNSDDGYVPQDTGLPDGRAASVSLKSQLMVIAGVITLLTLALVGVAFWGFLDSQTHISTIKDEHLQNILLFGSIEEQLAEIHLKNTNTLPNGVTQGSVETTALKATVSARIQENSKATAQVTDNIRKQLETLRNRPAFANAQPTIDLIRENIIRYRQGSQFYFDQIRKSIKDTASLFNEDFPIGNEPVTFSELEIVNPYTRILNRSYNEIQKELRQLAYTERKAIEALTEQNPNATKTIWLLVLGGALLVFTASTAFYLRRQVTQAVKQLTYMVGQLSRGNLAVKPAPIAVQEFASLAQSVNRLTLNLNGIAGFAREIGQGQFSNTFSPTSERDQLAIALIEMRNRLQFIAEEDQRRNWAVQGIAQFSDFLRVSEEVDEVAEQVIANLTKYIRGNQGAFFLMNDDDPSDVKLELIASYAYNKKKWGHREFRLGEGFVGQAAAEKDVILIRDIPVDYITMTSGLGEATPKSLLIMPLMHNNVVHGAVEIASFAPFENFQIDFVRKVSENIAATIGTLKSKAKTVRLLKDSEKLSAELQAKQEQILTNAARLQEQQTLMLKTQQELDGQLAALNNAGIVSETDINGTITFVNDKFVQISHYRREDLIGQNHRILKAAVQPLPHLFTELWETILDGKVWHGEFRNKNRHGAPYYVEATITPILDVDGKIKKFVSVQFDITHQKNQEEQIRIALEESMAQEEELRQNTEELEASQEEMRRAQIELNGQISALNNSAIVSEADLQGRIISVNEQFIRISRYGREELIGQNHRILKSGHQVDDIFESLWKTVTSGKVWKGEFKNKAKNGTHYWVTASITPVLDNRGKPMKYIGVTFDITAQKLQEEQIRAALEISQQQEAELRQNSEELQAAQEEMRKTQIELRGQIGALNNAGIVAESDLRGNITSLNEEFCRISKYKREELLGQNHRLLKSGYHTEDWYASLWETIQMGKVWQGVFKNRAKDGEFYWVKSCITPVMGFDGKPIKYIGVSFDITAQIRQEETIQVALMKSQAQEEELRQNAEAMMATQIELNGQMNAIHHATIVSEANLKGEIISCNDEFVAISGYTKAELLGQRHSVVASGYHPESFWAELWQTILRGQVWKGEIRNRTKHGAEFWVATTITPVLDSDGAPLKFIGIQIDITTIKTQEAQLLEALEVSKQQEAELRQSAELMLATQIELDGQIGALNNAAIVSETDLNGTITLVNEEAEVLWGYSRQELIGQNHRILRSDEHPPKFYAKMWEKISEGLVWRGDIRNRTKDGSELWEMLVITPVLGVDGKPVKYIGVGFDITTGKVQSRRIKQALAEAEKNALSMQAVQEEMTRTALELNGRVRAMDNAAMVTESDLTGTITYANEETLITWRYGRDELVGQNHRIVKSDYHNEKFFQRMWDKITQGLVWQGQLKNIAKDGTEFWIQLTITPVLGQDGTPYKYIGISFDMTAQKNQAARIREALDQSEAQEKTLKYEVERLQMELQEAARTTANWDALPLPIFEIDRHLTVTYRNQAFSTSLGLAPTLPELSVVALLKKDPQGLGVLYEKIELLPDEFELPLSFAWKNTDFVCLTRFLRIGMPTDEFVCYRVLCLPYQSSLPILVGAQLSEAVGLGQPTVQVPAIVPATQPVVTPTQVSTPKTEPEWNNSNFEI
jgi:PAS domain S-box-containing protein